MGKRELELGSLIEAIESRLADEIAARVIASLRAESQQRGERGAAEPILLRAGEAAAYIGIAPQTLANWRSLGEGPVWVHRGSTIRYRPEDLREWVNAEFIPADRAARS